MKFAKELEQDLVPEWRIKYLNYKAGKKYVKGVSRAINKANGTPLGVGRRGELPPRATPSFYSPFTPRKQNGSTRLETSEDVDPLSSASAPMGHGKVKRSPAMTPADTRKESATQGKSTGSLPIPISPENQSLTRSPGNDGNYGSFVLTPPLGPTFGSHQSFELPGPAIRVPTEPHPHRPTDDLNRSLSRLVLKRSVSMAPAVPTGGQSSSLPRSNTVSTQNEPGRLRRLFSSGPSLTRNESNRTDYGMVALDNVRQRERDFFEFLDGELEKVETFYKQKEDQAGERLRLLRDQLHEMRNRRTDELAEVRERKERENGTKDDAKDKSKGSDGHHGWIDPIKTKIFKPGPNSKALQKMPLTPVFTGIATDNDRDYVRRPHEHDVPYRTAKRKLKLALQEFYRGLELLKSYTILNRTAFRKLNKKYDKAVNARPPYRYMNEKVNKAWFVNSDIIDGHIKSVEDLYARYFERGNHKIAAGKLRRATRKPGDESGSTFFNGLFIGTGAVFTFQGLVYGAQLLFDNDPLVREHTSYLMQIYGGYFLMLFLFSLFCIDCYLWTSSRINYPFIFEFDPRHNLDWRQLSQFPSFCLFLLGIFIWLNFTRYGSPAMYLYYPVILIFLTLILILLPIPILGHRSRKWFAYSHYRLFFAGLYPVEFRDFFLGDIYCSLTYATCNIELFFCLYAHDWNDPTQCNSSHSRLLGFFSAMPPIWRALQCIRRYLDTKNVFPHLVNCGKYSMTIMAAVTLSLYRISGTNSNLALFATFSVVNSIYCSVWDLLMDFSLLQPDARHLFLRDILALKRRWLYYAIMVIDPILRFAWIFYAIFTHDAQHNTIVSFLVAFAEVCRRGMWALLRVENEHCGNVAQYKASRDVPLPYRLENEQFVQQVSEDTTDRSLQDQEPARASAVEVDTPGSAARSKKHTAPPSPVGRTTSATEEGGLRRRTNTEVTRSGGGLIRKIMAEAHKQDFEKKRRPPPEASKEEDLDGDEVLPSDDDDDDDDDSGSLLDERMEVRQVQGLIKDEESDQER